MARRSKTLRLGVFLNSRHVGHLTQDASGAVDFRYAPDWLTWDSTLPVSLSLPLREDRYIGAPVLAVFDNLLPDNQGLRKTVAERVGAAGTDAISLLAALGRDCVGALQFLPDGVEPGPAGVVEGTPISDAEIAETLRNLATHPLGMNRAKDFRISIAGAQEKTALLKRRGRWLRPAGSTPTTHIFKPQIGRLPNGLDLSNSVENEYLCLKLTEAFGLPTASAEMAAFEDKRVLIVERFDRLWAQDGRLLRVPQEDMCQVLGRPWTQKYESEGGPGILDIAHALGASDEPGLDRLTFLKANLIFWLLGATDGHAKNFSVFLYPGGGFRLTPLYDVISAQPSFDAKHVRHKDFKLAMAVGKARRYGILALQRRHFVETAELSGIGSRNAAGLIEEVIEASPKAIHRAVSRLPKDFPGEIAASIVHGVKSRVAQLAKQGERVTS
jgi:serine/threonine-protein kinase HipA